MPYKKALFYLLALMMLTACQQDDQSIASAREQEKAIPVWNKANLSDFDNYSMLSMQDDWKIVTWSSRASSQPGNANKAGISSIVSILKKEKQNWRVVSQEQFAHGYNPRSQLHTEFTLAGKPVVILKIQQRVAYEELLVYGMVQSEYKLLQTLVARAFEWTYDKAGNKKSLLVIPASHGEQAEFYQWNGQRFMLIQAADAAEPAKESADYVID